jgi:hypothetical protein
MMSAYELLEMVRSLLRCPEEYREVRWTNMGDMAICGIKHNIDADALVAIVEETKGLYVVSDLPYASPLLEWHNTRQIVIGYF